MLHDGEYVCGKCGIVDQELTAQLAAQITGDMAAKAMGEDHYVGNAGRVDGGLGSQMRYFTPHNAGEIFPLGNRFAKDFSGKRVKTAVL